MFRQSQFKKIDLDSIFVSFFGMMSKTGQMRDWVDLLSGLETGVLSGCFVQVQKSVRLSFVSCELIEIEICCLELA